MKKEINAYNKETDFIVYSYKKDGSRSGKRNATNKEKRMFFNAYYYWLFKRLDKARYYGDEAGGRLGTYGIFTYIEYKPIWIKKKEKNSSYQNFKKIERPYKITIVARPYHGYPRGDYLDKRTFNDPKKAFVELKTNVYFNDLWTDLNLRKLWYSQMSNYTYVFDEETNLFIKNKVGKMIKYYNMEDKTYY